MSSQDWLTCTNDKTFSQRLKKALNSGDYTALKRLIKGGVDINARFWYDSTLLHEAVTIGKLQIVELLIQNKAKVNAKNKDGRTALHIATRAGRLGIVECLLKAGAHINQQTADGQTALHIAIWREKSDIMEALLQSGAQVNIPDNDGWLPLHWATKRNFSLAVQQLVERQALIDCKIPKTGQTPFDQAVENSHLDLMEYLLLHGANMSSPINRRSAAFTLMKDIHLSVQQIMDTVDFFIESGYVIQNDHWLRTGKLPDRLANHEEFQNWLLRCRNSVQSLTCICRSSVRKHLSLCTGGRSIINRITSLSLPNILADYLMFKDRVQNSAIKIQSS